MESFHDHGIDLPSGASGEVRTLCPQCSPGRKKQRDKCLAVNVEEGTFFCHHCSWTGGLKKDKPKVASPPPIKKPNYRAETKLPEPVLTWFHGRGIGPKVLLENRIGYGQGFQDAKTIQFPYLCKGEVVNVKHRTGDKRFRQEKNAMKCLYRLDAISEENPGENLIITEGEMDALSFCEAGFNAVTSCPDGAPSVDAKAYHSKFDFLLGAESIFERHKKIILAVDNDAPGKVLERELARRIGIEKCYRVRYPDGCKDGNDVLVKHGAKALRQVVADSKPYPVDGLYGIHDLADDVLNLYDRGVNPGASVGWAPLDNFYHARPGEFTIITGIPSSGKSNWLDAVIVNLIKWGDWPFAIFSAENWPPERHMQSFLEKYLGRSFDRDGRENQRMTRETAKEGMDILDGLLHFIVPKDDVLTVDNILEKARVAIFRHGCKGVIIDPWNEVEHNFGKLTETQYISQELTKVRSFARRHLVHVWVVAHPRNLVKDKDSGDYKPPTPYEISGGANWRNKADVCICVHRPDMETNETQIFVQKVRFKEVGKPGKVSLRYCYETGRYFT